MDKLSLSDNEQLIFRYLLRYPQRPIYTSSFYSSTIAADTRLGIPTIDSIMPNIAMIMDVDNTEIITDDMYSKNGITAFRIYDTTYLHNIAVLCNIDFMYFGQKDCAGGGFSYITLYSNTKDVIYEDYLLKNKF